MSHQHEWVSARAVGSSGCAQPCEPVTQPAPAIPLGWQCPVCHVVLSPLIGRCDHLWPQMDLTPRAAA